MTLTCTLLLLLLLLLSALLCDALIDIMTVMMTSPIIIRRHAYSDGYVVVMGDLPWDGRHNRNNLTRCALLRDQPHILLLQRNLCMLDGDGYPDRDAPRRWAY